MPKFFWSFGMRSGLSGSHIFEGMNAGDALSISRTESRVHGVHCAGALFCWKMMNASTRHASLVAAAVAVARHDSKRH